MFKLAASIASGLQVSDQPIKESSLINHIIGFFLWEKRELAEVFTSERRQSAVFSRMFRTKPFKNL